MSRNWLVIALTVFSSQVFALQDTPGLEASSSHYVRDDLFVFMHAGAGRNYRILDSIEAGTPITILQHNREAEFSEIRDNEGRTGWIETRFISDQMSTREQVPILSERLADSQATLQSSQSENQQLNQQLNEARQQVSRLTAQVEEQTQEIGELTEQLNASDKKELYRWFTNGGLVAGGGIILGLIISYLPKKRSRGDTWM